MQNVDVIVEVGLHQFGDPDLIFICTDRDRTHRYIILEAKIVPYETSAKSNSDGMVYGYNSSINGQLALKYRFVQALSQWTGKERRIEEPAELFEAYQKTLNDPNKGPRRLAKSLSIDKKDIDFENYPVIHTENLRNLPELQPAMAKLAALCQAIFPPRDFVIHNGSYSIKHNNITVIKLATNRKDREHIYLGISAQIPELYKSLPISNKFNSPFSLNTGGESYPFDGIAILPDNLDDLLPELEELFKVIYYEYLQEDEY